ncbi:MAG: hypothetical protein JWQ25_1296 [Daejeonella sp.]|nr:hypothetical protein [Daejeonella sp.]
MIYFLETRFDSKAILTGLLDFALGIEVKILFASFDGIRAGRQKDCNEKPARTPRNMFFQKMSSNKWHQVIRSSPQNPSSLIFFSTTTPYFSAIFLISADFPINTN